MIILQWGCRPSTLPNSGCPPDPHRVPAPCSSGWGGGPPFKRMWKKFPCTPSCCSFSRKEPLEPVKPESWGAAWMQSMSEFSEPVRRHVWESLLEPVPFLRLKLIRVKPCLSQESAACHQAVPEKGLVSTLGLACGKTHSYCVPFSGDSCSSNKSMSSHEVCGWQASAPQRHL